MGIPGSGLSYRQRLGGGRSYSTPSTALTEDQIKTMGNRENDETALSVFRGGAQNLSVSPEEARRYLADPRFKLMDPETGRRLTPAKLEAMIQANQLKEKLENLQVQLQTETEEYQHLLNFWQPLPAIPSGEDWQAAREKRPFASRLVAPAPPDLPLEQAKYLDELTAREHTGLNKFLPGFVARSDAKSDFQTLWPERETQVQQAYHERHQQYEQQVAAESAAWDETEAKRIDWVKRLLAGDLEEINHTIAEVLTGLQLPFKTHCDYFLQDGRSVCLQVNLPELEEVIPETTKEILKDGSSREVRRTKAARQTDYTRLAMGEGLFMAAELFSYLPLAREIKVAAYAQRPRIKETDPLDSYVLDVTFNPEAVKGFGREDNLSALFARLGGRFDVNADGGLNRIEPPAWLQHADYQHLQ